MSELDDILDPELAIVDPRITVQQVFDFVKGDAAPRAAGRATTLGSTKSLLECYDLVRRAIDDYESRAGVAEGNKICFTEEEPDVDSETESVVFSLIERLPGQFAQGQPMSRDHVNLRPMIRDEFNDPENPGYRCVVNGYYYDNIVRFTCWARTNKAANARAEWFENLMEEYSWWFKLQGVDRVVFWGRNADLVTEVSENKWYGRPIDYFVRTEKIRVFQEKTLEEILIKLSVKRE